MLYPDSVRFIWDSVADQQPQVYWNEKTSYKMSKDLFTPDIGVLLGGSDHMWTALDTGVNAPKKHRDPVAQLGFFWECLGKYALGRFKDRLLN